MRAISRCIEITTCKIIFYDSERCETFTEYMQFEGKHTERGLIRMAIHNLSPPRYILVRIISKETKKYICSLSTEEFIKYSTKKEV